MFADPKGQTGAALSQQKSTSEADVRENRTARLQIVERCAPRERLG